MGSDVNRAVIERMSDLYRAGDLEAIERAALDYWTEQTVEVFPQSGEVFRGLAAMAAFVDASAAAFGGWPEFTLRELRGRDDLCVIEGTIRYSDGSLVETVTIVELADGMIRRQTDYFASPFEPPAWREPYRQA